MPHVGDLARKKIYPALFALYVEDMLPENFSVYGYARSKMSDEEFRDYIGGSLTCRVTDEDSCGDKYDTFLERCYYQPGQYSDESDFKALSERMTGTEKAGSHLMPKLWHLTGFGCPCVVVSPYRSCEAGVSASCF